MHNDLLQRLGDISFGIVDHSFPYPLNLLILFKFGTFNLILKFADVLNQFLLSNAYGISSRHTSCDHQSTYDIGGMSCIWRVLGTEVSNDTAAGIPVGLQSCGELKWHAYISINPVTMSFTPALITGEMRVVDEFLLIVSGILGLLLPCGWAEAIAKCGGKERKRWPGKSSPLSNPLLSYSSSIRNRYATLISRENAEPTLREMWVHYLVRARTPQTEAVKATVPILDG